MNDVTESHHDDATSPDPIPPGVAGRIPDVLAVIESAKARGGMEALQRFAARSLPDAGEAEVRDAAEVALEIIESIPVFLARARVEAHERRLSRFVHPLLDHVEYYYLQPVDLIPEMTQGLPGLLDDTYLVIRMIENLEKGPQPFLDWDLEYPARFLQRLIGSAICQRLDLIAAQAMDEVSMNMSEVWERIAHEA